MQTKIDFSKQLIKGKIAELAFSQMFINGNKFTVIPFGYESTFPEISQFANLAKDKQAVEIIRNAPDFAIVSHDKKEVYLVEVKYRSNPSDIQMLEMAEKIKSKWQSVYIFLATPLGFFFDNCNTIIENQGKISPLGKEWVEISDQLEYVSLINEFINSKN